ncbi:MAG: 2-phosphosulfolactate phosphatase [Bacteroidetes bacterium]|nr:2-phosphosulfolactate phosphatase [Bacteroidota bacterium]
MKINVLMSPLNADELYFTGKTTVVIDVLRATSVIANALNNGAREVIPVGSVDFAMKISGNAHGGQTLLCGERNTVMIEGFSLGNSPLEFTQEVVQGKSIILFTTNGSKAIVRAKFSANLFTASYNNLKAIADHLLKLGNDVEIMCAGKNGMFSLEDTACAGKLISELMNGDKTIELADAAKASLVINNSYNDDLQIHLANTEHGQLLIQNKFDEDIKFCATENNIEIIPIFQDGVIKVLKQETE